MSLRKAAMASVRLAFNSGAWEPKASDWIAAAQCIQLEEKERIGKFVFKRDAKSSMIGRLMLRKMLHNLTQIPYNDIKLGRTEKGKPYLMNDVPDECHGLSFNVSHHGDYVVLAAETEAVVGVDVMKLETPFGAKTVNDFFHTMRRQFTEDEWKCIRSGSTEKDQLGTFYRLWCLKESYVKALGIGIGFEVKRLNFKLAGSLPSEGSILTSTMLEIDDEYLEDWKFEESLIENHCVAVALKSQKTLTSMEKESPKFQILTFEELLADTSPLSDPDEDYGKLFIDKPESPLTLKKLNGMV